MESFSAVARKQRLLDSNAPSIVKVEEVSKSFMKRERGRNGFVKVLEDVSFELRAGSFVSVVGPSGCGKTTLLRIVDGLLKPDSGRVIFNGEAVTSPPAKMGFVFQQFGLLPWRNVLKNVEFGLELRGVDPGDREQIARKYIEIVGLGGYENQYIHEISSGMQQRVGLARALSIDPDVLLMDEPFASIDMQTREILQKQLLHIVKGTVPKTTLFITHNVEEAVYLSDEILLIGTRPAKVVEVVKVTLPPERWKYEDIHSEPEYVELRRRIWKFLEKEIMQSGGFGSLDVAGT